MSVLLFAITDFPNGTATTAHCSLIIKGFRKNGASAFLVIPSGYFNIQKINKNLNKGHFLDVPYLFLNYVDSPNSKQRKNVFKGLINSVSLLFKRWKKNRKDVVLIYSSEIILYFPIILFCIIFRIPFYPWQVEKFSSSEDLDGFKKKYKYVLAVLTEKLLPKISKGIIVISSHLKNFYSQNIPGEKIILSPILVNPEECQDLDQCEIDNFKINYNKRVIVYSGTFGEKEGFQYILQAFKKFIEIYPDSVLVVTGKPYKNFSINNIHYQVEELGLKENFEYLGLVSREQLKIINNAADLLLVCRSNSIFANHGFPWKLGEYCMTSRPIIATRVSDIEKYFKGRENIFLANPEDPDSIFTEMKAVFDDYPEALEIAKKGFEKACSVFNYQIETKKILEFVK